MKISESPTHHGVVVFARFDDQVKGFGFIEPAGSDGKRERNVFFNGYATQGRTDWEVGNEVDYILSQHHDRGLSAHRVWKRSHERSYGY